MEISIGSIVAKIDGVLDKMVSMETIKTKRRETMNKLLQTIAGTDVKREDVCFEGRGDEWRGQEEERERERERERAVER